MNGVVPVDVPACICSKCKASATPRKGRIGTSAVAGHQGHHGVAVVATVTGFVLLGCGALQLQEMPKSRLSHCVNRT